MTNQIPQAVVNDLAPSGTLRAAMNFGNTVLAQQDPTSGEPLGVTPALSRELGRRLGVPVQFVTFDTAGKVSASATAGAWDICFLADDPKRAEVIDFTAPYVVIEGTYAVPTDSALQTIEAVDAPGIRIAVGQNTAYDLYLTRAIQKAELVRAPTSIAAVELFMRDRLDAVAGVRQPLVALAASTPGLRVIEGRFMAINQAMGVPKGREAGAGYIRAFIEEMKASGFVAEALHKSGQGDATVAPPARI